MLRYLWTLLSLFPIDLYNFRPSFPMFKNILCICEVILYQTNLSVGYRIKSKRGVQFRQWATQRLKDYLVKGYAINQKRLEENKTQFLQTLENLKNMITLINV